MNNFERDPEKILQKIEGLRNLGYARIHLPGGTSKDKSHFAATVVPYYDSVSQKTFFIGIPYNPIYYHDKDDKNGHNKQNGTPEETARRELMEETSLNGNLEDFIHVYSPPPISDNRKNGKEHTKHFFLLEQFSGELASYDGPNPIDGETAAPILIPADMMKELLFSGHIAGFKAACEKLSGKNMDYAYSLMNLFSEI